MYLFTLLADVDCGIGGCPPDPGPGLGINNPVLPKSIGNLGFLGSGAKILELFLTNFVGIAFGVGGVIAFFMLIWGGYEWIVAAGDKEALQKAQKRITNALIGLALLLSVFAIISVIEILFGISLIKFTIPTIE